MDVRKHQARSRRCQKEKRHVDHVAEVARLKEEGWAPLGYEPLTGLFRYYHPEGPDSVRKTVSTRDRWDNEVVVYPTWFTEAAASMAKALERYAGQLKTMLEKSLREGGLTAEAETILAMEVLAE